MVRSFFSPAFLRVGYSLKILDADPCLGECLGVTAGFFKGGCQYFGRFIAELGAEGGNLPKPGLVGRLKKKINLKLKIPKRLPKYGKITFHMATFIYNVIY
jgi:hypothetical protein